MRRAQAPPLTGPRTNRTLTALFPVMAMDVTLSAWIWVACLGGAGGAVSAWAARKPAAQPVLTGRARRARRAVDLGLLGHIAMGAAIAGATAAATAWLIGSAAPPPTWVGTRAIPAAFAFFWIGFVTAGWLAAERDKRVLRQAVCRAAAAPAAHPDTVLALAHASPDAVFEAVNALLPRRVVH